MTPSQIVSWVSAILRDWDVLPYIQAGMLITITIGTMVAVANWLSSRN